MYLKRILSKIIICIVLPLSAVTAQQTSNHALVKGTVIDKETGDALPGANVIVVGTTRGSATDLDGNFAIKLPPGTYTIAASMIGYAKSTQTNVMLSIGNDVQLSFALSIEVIAGDEVVVEARAQRDSEAILLKDRKESSAVSDAVSSETMSKTGAGDAASAMSRTVGATVVDGKYVYVRGLGDRYGITQLNGATLPSADPDKQAVQMDIIPSSLLDNIVTTKTATPDKPGNFAGGSVNIGTKDFPDGLDVRFSTSSGFNSQSNLKNDFLGYSGGGDDWLGRDDGLRELPAELQDRNFEIPSRGSAFTNAEAAMELDRISKLFTPVMAPGARSVGINQGYSFSLANKYQLFNRPVGFISSLTYNRSFSAYDDGVAASYKLTGNAANTNELTNDYLLADSKSSDEAALAGLAKLAFQPATNHEISATYMYNRSGESTARYLIGELPRDLSGTALYESRVLGYVQRDLGSLQLRGVHTLPALNNLEISWLTSRSQSEQNEPDLRFFTNTLTVRDRPSGIDTLYSIQTSIYPAPSRYFRDLNEDNTESKFDMTLPFSIASDRVSKFKMGGSHLQKDRTFRERRFEFRQDAVNYNGDPVNFFADYTGINEDKSTSRFFRFGNYVLDATQLSSNYDGDQNIWAGYAMVDMPLTSKLRFIGGARYESTDMLVVSQDSTKGIGDLEEQDWLPSANLQYDLTNTQKLRAAYGRTLARPTFRELAPFASFEFVNDYIFVGNPFLKRTLIDNLDLRWEKYGRPGEIYAISGFYKKFQNPIERVVNPIAANPEVQYRNVDEGLVLGLELESRKRLDAISSLLNNFELGANLSLIHSEVEIAEDELAAIRAVNSDASDKRPLLGQSDYVLNANVVYDNIENGTVVSFYYNLIGKRLSEVATGGTPDIFERPRHQFDIIASKRIWNNLTLGFAAKNLLNSKIRRSHLYKGNEFVVQEFLRGRSFAVKLNYSLY